MKKITLIDCYISSDTVLGKLELMIKELRSNNEISTRNLLIKKIKMLTMYMLVLALLGLILPSQAIDATYSTSANMPSEYELNVTYLMREKIQFDVWVKRGYTLELALGYSISNVDTINFVGNWPYVTNKYEYTSWNVTDTTNQKRCEV